MKRYFLLLAISACCFLQTTLAQGGAPTTPAPVPGEGRGYLLGPGDQITVKVLGEPQFDFVAELSDDGKIEVPFFEQPIYAMCKNDREVRADVIKLLSKYLRSPQVNLTISERKSRPPVIVNGEVRAAQPIGLMRKARLLELINAAGGITESAGGMIQVFRTQAPICGDPEEINEWKEQAEHNGGVVSNMYSYSNLRIGSLEANPVIYPGDFIVVHKAAPVYFTGEIRSAQGVHIPEGGLSLFQAVAMLGGVNREAKTKDIKIYRLKANSKDRETISVNYDKIRKGEQKDVMLEPYDIVEVDKSKKGLLPSIFEMMVGAGKMTFNSIGGGIPQRILY